MKKVAKSIGGVLAAAGVFVAVCTVDGSANELAIRFGGLLTFIAGVLVVSKAETHEKAETHRA